MALLVTTGKATLAQDVDLANLGTKGFRVDGADMRDFSGTSVSGAGDVNGDGLADLIIGAYGADRDGKVAAGASYVVFGKTTATNVNLGNLGAGGFRIEGIDAFDFLGASVSGAGDVNGDGLADLIVGAPGSNNGTSESFVVFGKTTATNVTLDNLGAGGFRINGRLEGDFSGISVSGAGDVNGDGLADLIVGAFRAAPNGVVEAGESFVVFGKTTATTVNLSNLSTGGFRISGIDPGDHSGFSVSGIRDVNGDGLADLAVGAYRAAPGGECYVVFGKTTASSVELGNLADGGFRIDGIDQDDFLGFSVSGAGDVNGDGLADLVVGASSANSGGVRAGESYVIFGKKTSTTVDLGNLANGGFRIDGIDQDDFSGSSVSSASDVNGDGLADLIIGAYGGDPGGNDAAGESHVVFGKTTATTVNLANLGSSGFRIDGANADDLSGRSVSGAGDVNGDGLADLIVGASRADGGDAIEAGESYVVFSQQTALSSATYRAFARNGDAPALAIGISGDGSNDSHPDARAWVDFADGASISGEASLVTVTLNRSTGGLPAPGASVHWEVSANRNGWTSAELRFRYLDSELNTDENFLRLFFSPNGNAPFTALDTTVNPTNNTISATTNQLGFFFIGNDIVFLDGFENSLQGF